ncbi:hypothetical protein DFAR_1240015 [Desulfarculales bacterium]
MGTRYREALSSQEYRLAAPPPSQRTSRRIVSRRSRARAHARVSSLDGGLGRWHPPAPGRV